MRVSATIRKYWSVTEGDHVIYESRLELSHLRIADFNLKVHRIKAQPFLLTAIVNGRKGTHVPDFLLRTDGGPVVIDVVRAERLQNPKVQILCAWTRRVVESLSWRYEVAREQPPVLLSNIRFLAQYRQEYRINQDALRQIRSSAADLAGIRIDDAERRLGVAGIPHPLARSALLHTLWRQEFAVDLSQQLRPSTVLEAPKRVELVYRSG